MLALKNDLYWLWLLKTTCRHQVWWPEDRSCHALLSQVITAGNIGEILSQVTNGNNCEILSLIPSLSSIPSSQVTFRLLKTGIISLIIRSSLPLSLWSSLLSSWLPYSTYLYLDFHLLLGGGYSIQGVVKCLSPYFTQDWAFLTNFFCKIYMTSEKMRVSSQKLIHWSRKHAKKTQFSKNFS